MQRYEHGGCLSRRFHPIPEGCVMHDARMVRAVEELYAEELSAMAAASLRSMLCEPHDSALSEAFHAQMCDEIAHVRVLGELILALGGAPTLRAQIRVDCLRTHDAAREEPPLFLRTLAEGAWREKRRSVDRYQTILGRTQDRVVRSLLLSLIDEEQRHAAYLRQICEQDKN